MKQSKKIINSNTNLADKIVKRILQQHTIQPDSQSKNDLIQFGDTTASMSVTPQPGPVLSPAENARRLRENEKGERLEERREARRRR
jgi:hypothetical protein